MLLELGALGAAALLAAAEPEQPPATLPPAAPSQAPPATQPPPGVSAEDWARIQKGTAADKAAATPKASSPEPTTGAPSAIAGAIQSMNPDLAAVLDVVGAAYNHAPILVGGHDPTGTGFTLQELELHLGAEADPYFRMDGNIVFLARDVELEEAYATTLAFPANLQLRAGLFLTDFGRINPTHPHQWNFVDETMVVRKFLGEDGSRGVGPEISWLSPLPWYATLSASVTAPPGDCCGRSFTFGDVPVRTGMVLVGTARLAQFFPFGTDWSLLWGLSTQIGNNQSGVQRHTQIYGTDLYVRFRPVDAPTRTAVSWQSEFLYRNRQIPRDNLHDYGGYSQLVWNIDPNWETGVRAELTSGTKDDPLDPFWTSNRSRYSAQLTYYPSHFTRVRAQFNLDDPTFQDQRPIVGGLLALEVVVGAHGAHNY